MKKLLSKSRVMAGLQCHKRLYLELFNKSLARSRTPGELQLFKMGHEVGDEAQKHYPGGVLMDAPHWDFKKNIEMTNQAIAEGHQCIYEASFQYENYYCRVDILNKKESGWELIEVKASTQAKDQHLSDAAYQSWVLLKLGMKVNSVRIMHINNQCIAPDLSHLFFEVDFTEDAKKLYPLIEDHLSQIDKVIDSSRAPHINVGPHCDVPYECLFKEHCFQSQLIPKPSVFDLPGLGKKAWEFYKKDQVALHDLEMSELNELQQRAVKASQSGQAFIDSEGIQSELQAWEFPLNYLDFETSSYAVPKINGTRPYESIPFQYSLHIEETEGAELEHKEFLDVQGGDPRRRLVEKLILDVGPQGSVVAYNKSFEARCLRDLAEACPEYKRQLLDIERRLVDPLPIFQRSVYHPEFFGSFSIKYVAPALLGDELSYKNLKIQDGAMAQVGYQEMLNLPGGSAEREELRAGLIEYCCQDTLAMVRLVQWLRTKSKRSL